MKIHTPTPSKLHIFFFLLLFAIGQAQLGANTMESSKIIELASSYAPTVTAEGDQAYCPLSKQNIVTAFNIIDNNSKSTPAFYIQISSGYVFGEDKLILRGRHPKIKANWRARQAKLIFTPSSGTTIQYTDIINAVYDVVFISNNLNVGPKTFSLTIGKANFLDGHYYDFVSSYGIHWSTAKANAEAMRYYGLQGYLATITNANEAKICGELSLGTGWIGGSDAQTEGAWKWVTGPEAGKTFWFGHSNGSTAGADIPYENWNGGEPNNAGDEDYLHVYNKGTWNDYRNDTPIDGYIIEYGGMPGDPQINISASTKFRPRKTTTTKFDAIADVCEGTLITLPTTSKNGVTGTWLPAFDPNNTTTYTFTPNAGQCAKNTTLKVNIIKKTTPDFDPIADVCEGTRITLPTTSKNGVTGTWLPAFDPNNTTTYTFTPNAGQCAKNTTLKVNIIKKTTPDFDPIADVCEGTRITLPTTSKNGVTGTWSPAFDPNSTTTYTFTPNAGQCAKNTTLKVNIIKKTTPDFDPIADVCEGGRATLPTTSKNGVTGTWSPAFDPNNTTTYTFTPDAGQCAKNTTLKVNIIKKTTPDFDPIADVCEGGSATLPTTSKNGVTGTWSPAFDPNNTTTYIFTPSAGQCATTQKLTVNITKKTVPSFDPIADVCEGGRATLPTTSKNGVTGTWSSPFYNTKTTTYIFTPSAGQCATTQKLTVNITKKTVPSFDAIADVCEGGRATLPTTSKNGVTGTWSPAFDPNNTTTYIFTPDAGQCAKNTTLKVNIIKKTTPDFDPIADVCEGGRATLPTTSKNGVTGTWSSPFDNTKTTTYIFTPSAGQCATTQKLTVNITKKTVPSFDPIADVCEGGRATLPTTSKNGVTGTWSPAFDPNNTTTYTFTPNAGQCATNDTLKVNITKKTVPSFDPIADVCEGGRVTLPTTSKNGVTGTWSPAFDPNNTTTYTFTPDAGQCATNDTLKVNIIKKTTPDFDPIADVCEGTLITLPTTSKNGVTGTWSPAFDPNNTTTYTFTPNAGQCATKADLEVGIISKKVLSISAKITTETFSKSPEIKVTLKERKGQYEYQLNNENWQESPIFSGIVGCKKHTIRVRELGGCSRPGMTSITVMDFPKFFTPNGDGYNDNWTINCLKNKITSISIFDRYGKLIKQLSAGDIGWDGTYQGVRLPSSDYWFIIAYKEDGVEKQFKSHFSLKR